MKKKQVARFSSTQFTDEQIDNLLQICEFKVEYHQHFPDDAEEEIAKDLYDYIRVTTHIQGSR